MPRRCVHDRLDHDASRARVRGQGGDGGGKLRGAGESTIEPTTASSRGRSWGRRRPDPRAGFLTRSPTYDFGMNRNICASLAATRHETTVIRRGRAARCRRRYTRGGLLRNGPGTGGNEVRHRREARGKTARQGHGRVRYLLGHPDASLHALRRPDLQDESAAARRTSREAPVDTGASWRSRQQTRLAVDPRRGEGWTQRETTPRGRPGGSDEGTPAPGTALKMNDRKLEGLRFLCRDPHLVQLPPPGAARDPHDSATCSRTSSAMDGSARHDARRTDIRK